MLSALRQDAGYAVRSFLKVPGLTAAIVVSIGLGIAANATVFSMVNALLLLHRDAEVLLPVHGEVWHGVLDVCRAIL